MRDKRILSLICSAMLVAISIILTRFLGMYLPIFGSNTLRISFGDVPILLAGLLFGPLYGAMSGIIADLTGSLLFSGLGYFPGFTLTAAFVGLVPGILSSFYKKNPRITRMLFIIILTEIIASMMNSLWLTITTGVDFTVLVLPRLAKDTAMACIFSILLQLIYKHLQKLLDSPGRISDAEMPPSTSQDK